MTELRQWIVTAVVFAGLAPLGALAETTLTRVQVVDANRVSLAFDQPLAKHQIQTEFIRDIVQLSLTDVTVYPAKIQSVNGQDFSKLFAYQFAPSVVRFRITVKGKAEDYRSRVQVITEGQTLTVKFTPKAQTAAALKVAAAKVAAAPIKPVAQAKVDEEIKMSDSEKALLDKVLSAEKPSEKVAEKPADKVADKTSDKEEKTDRLTTSKAQASAEAARLGRPERKATSPLKPLAITLGLIGLLGGVLLALRRFKIRSMSAPSIKGLSSKGLTGWLKSRVKGKGPTIEVLANHYLGPKKSISVVKVYGKVLVLGVSSDNINLIAQLNGNPENGEGLESLEQFMNFEAEESAKPAIDPKPQFSKVLGQEAAKPSNGVRSQIRSKLENLKQL